MWQIPPQSIELAANEVHIWKVDLVATKEWESQFWSSLSPEEQTRANRYHFQQHRSEFIIARGVLRHLLGKYTQQSAQSIHFGYGPQDKPFLIPASPISFNISHSHGLALFAFGIDVEIGIDLEKIQPKIDILQLAEHFFSKNEKNTIKKLSGAAQLQGFFTCWTRKEAFIKAKGKGLSLPLDQFEVSILPTDPAQLLVTQWDPTEAKKWHISSIPMETLYLAAIALNRDANDFKLWNFKL